MYVYIAFSNDDQNEFLLKGVLATMPFPYLLLGRAATQQH